MRKKKILTNVVVFAILMLYTTVAWASENPYIPTDITPVISGSEAGEYVENFLSALVWVGYAIVIGMLIFVGMKYMFAAADERASVKGMLVKIVIGAVIIAGATVIIQVLAHLATGAKT